MIKAMIFINKDVLKKLLNGLITKQIIMVIETAVHMQIFLVLSVKMLKLKLEFVSI
jgi:hypothetical protein